MHGEKTEAGCVWLARSRAVPADFLLPSSSQAHHHHHRVLEGSLAGRRAPSRSRIPSASRVASWTLITQGVIKHLKSGDDPPRSAGRGRRPLSGGVYSSQAGLRTYIQHPFPQVYNPTLTSETTIAGRAGAPSGQWRHVVERVVSREGGAGHVGPSSHCCFLPDTATRA